MIGTKIFCKRASEFKVSELELRDEYIKYITMAYKNHSLLLANARTFLTDFGEDVRWKERDLVASRIKRVLKCKDREKKAHDISSRFYEEVEEAGYIRDFSAIRQSRNWKPLRKLMREAVDKWQYAVKKANEFRLYSITCREALSFTDDQSELDERIHLLDKMSKYKLGSFMTAEQYEAYDIERLDSTAAEIMQTIFSPRQRELVDWFISSPWVDEVSFLRALTEEEDNLLLAAIYALIENAHGIKEVLKPFLL